LIFAGWFSSYSEFSFAVPNLATVDLPFANRIVHFDSIDRVQQEEIATGGAARNGDFDTVRKEIHRRLAGASMRAWMRTM